LISSHCCLLLHECNVLLSSKVRHIAHINLVFLPLLNLHHSILMLSNVLIQVHIIEEKIDKSVFPDLVSHPLMLTQLLPNLVDLKQVGSIIIVQWILY
jgi:hypothetical protein